MALPESAVGVVVNRSLVHGFEAVAAEAEVLEQQRRAVRPDPTLVRQEILVVLLEALGCTLAQQPQELPALQVLPQVEAEAGD